MNFMLSYGSTPIFPISFSIFTNTLDYVIEINTWTHDVNAKWLDGNNIETELTEGAFENSLQDPFIYFKFLTAINGEPT